MNDKDLKRIFLNAIKSPDTILLLEHFIHKSGCFRRGLAANDRLENYLRGYSDSGLYIRNLFLEYAPEIYANLIIRKGNNDE